MVSGRSVGLLGWGAAAEGSVDRASFDAAVLVCVEEVGDKDCFGDGAA